RRTASYPRCFTVSDDSLRLPYRSARCRLSDEPGAVLRRGHRSAQPVEYPHQHADFARTEIGSCGDGGAPRIQRPLLARGRRSTEEFLKGESGAIKLIRRRHLATAIDSLRKELVTTSPFGPSI